MSRTHSKFTMLLNIPKGRFPSDPEHGEATYVMYRDWCECDHLRDHASVTDLASTNSEPPKTHTKSAQPTNSKELGANNNE